MWFQTLLSVPEENPPDSQSVPLSRTEANCARRASSSGLNRDGEPFLQVQDSGIGMAQSDVEHMFERFYRSDEAREIKGTGLGLAIAKWIVDRHSGHFEILSRTELGTRIRMVLPKESIRDIAKAGENREDADERMQAAE